MYREYNKNLYLRIIAIIVIIGLLCPQAIVAQELPLKSDDPQKPPLVYFDQFETLKDKLEELVEAHEEIVCDDNITYENDESGNIVNVDDRYDDDGNSGYGFLDISGEKRETEPKPDTDSTLETEPEPETTPSDSIDETDKDDDGAAKIPQPDIQKPSESNETTVISPPDTSQQEEQNPEDTDYLNGEDALAISDKIELYENYLDEAEQGLKEIENIYDILTKTEGMTIDDARRLLQYYINGEQRNLAKVSDMESYTYQEIIEYIKKLILEIEQNMMKTKKEIDNLKVFGDECAKDELQYSEDGGPSVAQGYIVEKRSSLSALKQTMENLDAITATTAAQIETGEILLSKAVDEVVNLESSDSIETSEYSITEKEYSISNPADLLQYDVSNDDDVSNEDIVPAQQAQPLFYARNIEIEQKDNKKEEPLGHNNVINKVDNLFNDIRGNNPNRLTIEYIVDIAKGVAETEVTDGQSVILFNTDAIGLENEPLLFVVPDITNAVPKDDDNKDKDKNKNDDSFTPRHIILKDSAPVDSAIDSLFSNFSLIVSDSSHSQPNINLGMRKPLEPANDLSDNRGPQSNREVIFVDNSNSFFSDFYAATSKLLTILDNPQENLIVELRTLNDKTAYSVNKVFGEKETYKSTKPNVESVKALTEKTYVLSAHESAIDDLSPFELEDYAKLLSVLKVLLWEKQDIDPYFYLSQTNGVLSADESEAAIDSLARYLSRNIAQDAASIGKKIDVDELHRMLVERYAKSIPGLLKQEMDKAWSEFYEIADKDMKERMISDKDSIFKGLFNIYNKEVSNLFLNLYASFLAKISEDRIKDINTIKEITGLIRNQIYELVHTRNVATNEFYVDIAPYYEKLLSVLKEADWLWEKEGMDKNIYFVKEEDVLNNEKTRVAIEKLIAYVYKNKDNEDAAKIIELEKKLRIEYVEPALESFREKIRKASREFYELVEEKSRMLAGPSINNVDGELEVVIVLPKE